LEALSRGCPQLKEVSLLDLKCKAADVFNFVKNSPQLKLLGFDQVKDGTAKILFHMQFPNVVLSDIRGDFSIRWRSRYHLRDTVDFYQCIHVASI
jgi:hypothetical protein